ncbi:hypothetical protein [Rhodococcus sp. H29-C3]|uniref:hypothetical protein n=1 Tax=Rhodococcus sp. H29-C3 TaxID=3046307 RepID=UPI0024B89DE3|nr:hypothetical protein [Rhodococcus sp. H29-C3]MDJ0362482.1 hypothetical protein [Rhodococcus sp. H29-C3]
MSIVVQAFGDLTGIGVPEKHRGDVASILVFVSHASIEPGGELERAIPWDCGDLDWSDGGQGECVSPIENLPESPNTEVSVRRVGYHPNRVLDAAERNKVRRDTIHFIPDSRVTKLGETINDFCVRSPARNRERNVQVFRGSQQELMAQGIVKQVSAMGTEKHQIGRAQVIGLG